MIVINTQYNEFPEINHLNKNFIPGVKKLKVTIDAISSSKIYRNSYPIILKQFNMLFPNIKKHICCYEKIADGFKTIPSDTDFHDHITNLIHLIEHIVIDIQCSISKMRICSGITCNYYEPRNRYDIFVECVDERVGFYAVQLVTDIVFRILNSDRYFYDYTTQPQSQLPIYDLLNSHTYEYDFPSYITNYVFKDFENHKN